MDSFNSTANLTAGSSEQVLLAICKALCPSGNSVNHSSYKGARRHQRENQKIFYSIKYDSDKNPVGRRYK